MLRRRSNFAKLWCALAGATANSETQNSASPRAATLFGPSIGSIIGGVRVGVSRR
jgi:hypothetical protein